jgi:hypothetical protein
MTFALTVYDVALYGFALIGVACVVATVLVVWFASVVSHAFDRDR